ncbi:hypothetical protein PR048_012250 [Dryococelus australis]|uniref:Uncharacterized protein n=1 Tax=Dryococelus australis TaxID=614101 RepID=A0ABQ9HPH3_9NEOP|nr:hypothetical protein PR048_012250 [Dryococelus australis]
MPILLRRPIVTSLPSWVMDEGYCLLHKHARNSLHVSCIPLQKSKTAVCNYVEQHVWFISVRPSVWKQRDSYSYAARQIRSNTLVFARAVVPKALSGFIWNGGVLRWTIAGLFTIKSAMVQPTTKVFIVHSPNLQGDDLYLKKRRFSPLVLSQLLSKSSAEKKRRPVVYRNTLIENDFRDWIITHRIHLPPNQGRSGWLDGVVDVCRFGAASTDKRRRLGASSGVSWRLGLASWEVASPAAGYVNRGCGSGRRDDVGWGGVGRVVDHILFLSLLVGQVEMLDHQDLQLTCLPLPPTYTPPFHPTPPPNTTNTCASAPCRLSSVCRAPAPTHPPCSYRGFPTADAFATRFGTPRGARGGGGGNYAGEKCMCVFGLGTVRILPARAWEAQRRVRPEGGTEKEKLQKRRGEDSALDETRKDVSRRRPLMASCTPPPPFPPTTARCAMSARHCEATGNTPTEDGLVLLINFPGRDILVVRRGANSDKISKNRIGQHNKETYSNAAVLPDTTECKPVVGFEEVWRNGVGVRIGIRPAAILVRHLSTIKDQYDLAVKSPACAHERISPINLYLKNWSTLRKPKYTFAQEAGNEDNHEDSIDDNYDDSGSVENYDYSHDGPHITQTSFLRQVMRIRQKMLSILTICLPKIPTNLYTDLDICLVIRGHGVKVKVMGQVRRIKGQSSIANGHWNPRLGTGDVCQCGGHLPKWRLPTKMTDWIWARSFKITDKVSRSRFNVKAILHGTRFRKSLCKVCHSCCYTGLYGIRHGIFRLAQPDFITGLEIGLVLFSVAGSIPALVRCHSHCSFRAQGVPRGCYVKRVDEESGKEASILILHPGLGCIPGESPSTRVVSETTKHQQWLLEDHDVQVADQPYPRYVRWATCKANVQARSHVVSEAAPNHHNWRMSAMLLRDAGCQIAVTTVASNTYAAIAVGQLEAGLVRKHHILSLSTPVTAFTCLLWSEDFVVSGQWNRRNSMCATSPALSRGRLTFGADTRSSAPVSSQHCERGCTVHYRHANKMAVIPCCGHIAWSSTRSSLSTNLFYPLVSHTHHCRSSMPYMAPFDIDEAYWHLISLRLTASHLLNLA